jgi:hypothetical protein
MAGWRGSEEDDELDAGELRERRLNSGMGLAGGVEELDELELELEMVIHDPCKYAKR